MEDLTGEGGEKRELFLLFVQVIYKSTISSNKGFFKGG